MRGFEVGDYSQYNKLGVLAFLTSQSNVRLTLTSITNRAQESLLYR
jgi:hypothetical protein